MFSLTFIIISYFEIEETKRNLAKQRTQIDALESKKSTLDTQLNEKQNTLETKQREKN